jgi:hypothetical protein
LTGRGGDLIIIDDPLKPIDAQSQTKRSAVNAWYNNTLISRLDDKQTGAIVIVMQRVHIDDLTGFVLDNSAEWTVLNLAAIAQSDEAIPLLGGETHHRKIGDVLSPSREPLHILEGLKRQLGSDYFSAQYQQEPVPPGGAMIKRHWPRRYDGEPPRGRSSMILQSWDTASKGSPDNDYSVCTTWRLIDGTLWYLLDVYQLPNPQSKGRSARGDLESRSGPRRRRRHGDRPRSGITVRDTRHYGCQTGTGQGGAHVDGVDPL